MNKLATCQRSGKKVFTAQDLGVLWGYTDERNLYELIKYYVNSGHLYALARGLYSLEEYNEKNLREDSALLFEIANKLVPNSYISLYTAMRLHGLAFQYYDEMYSVAGRTAVRVVKGIRFIYKKIKDDILFNESGIEKRNFIRIAGVERTICDSLYFFPNLGLEYMEGAQKERLLEMARIYGNRQLTKRIAKLAEELNVEY
jgi:predicted transcriptional regulator of viral defense system